ncbi:glycosyltransferase [bacterium]|nr:glycosyltransferase [bacterium]
MPNNHHVCLIDSLRGLGGAELWFLDAARGLRERGVRTTLVVQPHSALATRAAEMGQDHRTVSIRFDGAPWTLSKLVRLFRAERATALVCNLTKDLKAAGTAGLIAGVPVRLASRESDFPLKSKGYYRWYFRRAATGVLVNSEATRRTVLASAPWLDPSRVHLLYKGIDLGRFAPRPDHAPDPGPVVGFAGQLIERKGIEALMAAWSRLEAEEWSTPPRLVLVGDGPLRDRLLTWRAALRRPDHVEVRGFTDDVPALWRACRCAVLPSRAEGFGLAAAEAAACGLPVVATRTSSLPELVEDGRTGLLVAVDEPAALAAALGDLLRDPARCRTLGEAGRALVADRFDHQRTLDRLQALVCPEESS